jgi:hypothetical protein
MTNIKPLEKELSDNVRPHSVILIEEDTSCGMARLSVNGHGVMEGNHGDFYPGCHGGWHYDLARRFGDYRGANGMAETLQAAVIAMGAETCVIEEGSYTFRY